jgi:hypothetical protein
VIGCTVVRGRSCGRWRSPVCIGVVPDAGVAAVPVDLHHRRRQSPALGDVRNVVDTLDRVGLPRHEQVVNVVLRGVQRDADADHLPVGIQIREHGVQVCDQSPRSWP